MAGPASSSEASAPQAAAPEPPAHVETDAATRIQEGLDKLLLACFNALLDVSKATATGGGAGAGGAAAASSSSSSQVRVCVCSWYVCGGIEPGRCGWDGIGETRRVEERPRGERKHANARSYGLQKKKKPIILNHHPEHPCRPNTRVQAALTGAAIGRTLRELGEAIDALPVLPPPEEEGVTRCDGSGFDCVRLDTEVVLCFPFCSCDCWYSAAPLFHINTQTSTFFYPASRLRGGGSRRWRESTSSSTRSSRMRSRRPVRASRGWSYLLLAWLLAW